MNRTPCPSLLALVTLLGLATACNGSDDDDTTNAPTCESVCSRQNQLCNLSDDCASMCSALRQRVQVTGCQAQYDEGIRCLAGINQCDDDSILCPSAPIVACFSAYCESHPTDAVCN